MELENLKKSWQELDKRVRENETATNRLTKEFANYKATSNLNKVIKNDVIGLSGLLIFIYIVYSICCQNNTNEYLLAAKQLPACFCFIFIPYYALKVYTIRKVDLLADVESNLKLLRRAELLFKYEIYALVIFGIITIPLAIFIYADLKASLWLWIFLICVVTGGIILSVSRVK